MRLHRLYVRAERRALRALWAIDARSISPRPHLPSLLAEQARAGVFGDSGAWETAALRTFDRLFRGWVWSTLLPLSEHSVGERVAAKVAAELFSSSLTGSARTAFAVSALLQLLGAALLILGGVCFGLPLLGLG